jgi:septum formation topological specificity factor MinE
MSFLGKIFGTSGAAAPASRAIAKDRLSVILASQRGSELLEGVNMEEMQRDVLAVVQVGNEKQPDFADAFPIICISLFLRFSLYFLFRCMYRDILILPRTSQLIFP